MRLRTLKIATVLACALLVITSVAWVSSYGTLAVRAHDGDLVVLFVSDGGFHPRNSARGNASYFSALRDSLNNPSPREREARVAGAWFFSIPRVVTGIAVPFAYVILVPLSLSVACGALWRREARRARLGLCLRCGYDLRHASGVCPECGAAAATAAAPTRTITEDDESEGHPDALPTAAAPRDAGGDRLRESQRTL